MPAWYDGSWLRRQKFTVDHTKIFENSTSFVAYLNLSNLHTGFFTNVQNGGGDIRITGADGVTECAREVVSCNTGTSKGEVWFKAVDAYSTTTNLDFYIYYKNAGVSDYATNATYGAQAVWATRFKAAWHFENSLNDSAVGAHTLTNVNNTTNATSGYIGQGRQFSNAQNMNLYNDSSDWEIYGSAHYAMQILMQYSAGADNTFEMMGISQGATYGTRDKYFLAGDTGITVIKSFESVIYNNANVTVSPANNAMNNGGTLTWYLLTMTYDGTNLGAQLNGGTRVTTATNSTYHETTPRLNFVNTVQRSAYNRILDESRVYADTISEAFVKNQYANMSANATFFIYNDEEIFSPPGGSGGGEIALLGVG